MLWAVVNELLIQPREYSAFSLSLERLRDDPRIAVTLGTPVSGYGQVRRLIRLRPGKAMALPSFMSPVCLIVGLHVRHNVEALTGHAGLL